MKVIFTILAALLAVPVEAGRYFVTGHDSDFHGAPGIVADPTDGEDSPEARRILQKAIQYITYDKPLPTVLLVTGNEPLGGESSADPRAGLAAAGYIPKVGGLVGLNAPSAISDGGVVRGYYEVATHSPEDWQNSHAVSLVEFKNFDGIVVASDFGGWLRQLELSDLNARALEIQDYVQTNATKGVVALAQSGSRWRNKSILSWHDIGSLRVSTWHKQRNPKSA